MFTYLFLYLSPCSILHEHSFRNNYVERYEDVLYMLFIFNDIGNVQSSRGKIENVERPK
jgi:hypothetical protein